MQRIMIVGGPGSGKSALARALGRRTGLPVVHADPFYFRAGWEERPKPEVYALFEAAAAEPRWIIDGNHSKSWDGRAARADLILFLDMPRRLLMWRVIRRMQRYRGRTRPDMAPGCPERFDPTFLRWTWGYHRNGRPKALALIAAHRQKSHHLRGRRAVKAFLAASDALGARP